MDRSDYISAFKILRKSKSLKDVKIPEDVFEFGFEIAQLKPKSWIIERISFWVFAYNKRHKWTNRDFLYEINDKAYAKARAHRKETKAQAVEDDLQRFNQPKPKQEPTTDWEDCSEAPQALKDLSEKLGSK